MIVRMMLMTVILAMSAPSWAQDLSKPDPLQQCQSSLQAANALGKQYYDTRDDLERKLVFYKVSNESLKARVNQAMAELEAMKKAAAAKPETPKE